MEIEDKKISEKLLQHKKYIRVEKKKRINLINIEFCKV